MKHYILSLLIAVSISQFSIAQVKIGSPGNPDASAVLELDGGTNKGFLLPRITATEMGLMTTAPDGMLVYNKTDGFVYIRKTSAWQKITDATNNGGFTLPYAGTASTVGGAEFSITHTTTLGDAAFFSNTATGAALTTGNGNNKLNMTTGNTGIGIPTGIIDNPTLGRLVVRGIVGNTSAVFGDKTSGVAIENELPAIAFNAYNNGGSKNIIDGYSARITQSPVSGLMSINTTSSSGTAGSSNDAIMVNRIAITPTGNTGIGTSSPIYPLDVNGRIRIRQNGANTAGVWFNNSVNTEASFLGQYTDTRLGIMTNSTWKFAVDGTDGTVFLGSSNLAAENLTTAAGYKLKVFGKMIAEEVRVQLKTAWPDYVFAKDYKLNELDEVERFINTNKHLPDMPSAAEIEKDGQQLGEVQRKLLEKVEELTLYVIQLKKEIEEMKSTPIKKN